MSNRNPDGHASLIDVDEAARMLGTSARHIRRLVAERRLPHVKVGHYLRFRPEDLDAFIDASYVSDQP